jgi:hypothetical protein
MEYTSTISHTESTPTQGTRRPEWNTQVQYTPTQATRRLEWNTQVPYYNLAGLYRRQHGLQGDWSRICRY